jgi:hypothetical protein
MVFYKDSNLGRRRLVSKMLKCRLDNLEPLRRSARGALALGLESAA